MKTEQKISRKNTQTLHEIKNGFADRVKCSCIPFYFVFGSYNMNLYELKFLITLVRAHTDTNTINFEKLECIPLTGIITIHCWTTTNCFYCSQQLSGTVKNWVNTEHVSNTVNREFSFCYTVLQFLIIQEVRPENGFYFVLVFLLNSDSDTRGQKPLEKI